MKYKEQKNTVTGETRWVPIEGSETVGEKVTGFVKGVAESTGIPKSLANIGALGATTVGGVQMALNKPEAAEKSYGTALNLRKYAGTEGSFDKGTGWKTIGAGALEAGKVASTAASIKGVQQLIKGASAYTRNVASQKGFMAKLNALRPSKNISISGGRMATEGAEASTKVFDKSQFLDEIISTTKKSRDPSQINALKNWLTQGASKEVRTSVNQASIDNVKDLVLGNTSLLKNLPNTMSEALDTRRAVGSLKQWTKFMNLFRSGKDSAKAANAADIYKIMNNQLHTVREIAKGDKIVQLANQIGIPVEIIAATSLLKGPAGKFVKGFIPSGGEK